MGREIRRVPANWQHPKNERGHYVPLLDGYNERVRKWDEANSKWAQGLQQDHKGRWKPISAGYVGMPFAKWDGERPEPKDYMPDWPLAERTHWQMYEDCTEGTPISPVMDDPETLAHWLAENEASALGSSTASYAQWLATIKAGWCPSMVSTRKTGLISGVESADMLPSK